MPMKAIEAFRFNMERARNLVGLYEQLTDQGADHEEIDDVLRASLVLSVGALDALVHDRVGEELVPYIKRSLKNDPDSLAIVERELASVETREMLTWLTRKRPFVQVRKVIETRLGAQSFQHPGKIEEAFQLIGRKGVWSQVAQDLGVSTSELKRKVVNAAKRRNQIVHEGDREKSKRKKGQKRPISQGEVNDVLDLIQSAGEKLCRL
jgi:hypothetical protein